MNKKEKEKTIKRNRRRKKIRVKINGTSERPRLSVFRSNSGLYLQLIDDNSGKTMVSAHSREVEKEKKSKEAKIKPVEQANELGKLLAQKAFDKKIEKAVFDRGGYKYHGRIKAVAEGAREGGLKF